MSETELLNSIAKMLEEHTKSINEQLASQETRIMSRIDSQEAKLDKVQINQEAVIMPRLDLLYEGHTAMLEKNAA